VAAQVQETTGESILDARVIVLFCFVLFCFVLLLLFLIFIYTLYFYIISANYNPTRKSESKRQMQLPVASNARRNMQKGMLLIAIYISYVPCSYSYIAIILATLKMHSISSSSKWPSHKQHCKYHRTCTKNMRMTNCDGS
jgi:hypothetical protein